MSNTYIPLYTHLVFAVKYLKALIQSDWEDRLHLYRMAILQHQGHKAPAVNSAYHHLYIFIGLNLKQSISNLMRIVKGEISEWINKEKFTSLKLQWQEGFGAFSHSKSRIDNIVKHIVNPKRTSQKELFQI
jgi:REP element-mobilizing transposase RayT